MQYLLGVFFILILILGGTRAECENRQAFESTQYPSLISNIRISGPLDFCGEPVPLEKPEVRERMEKELLLSLWDRPQVILWIKRSGRYMLLIEKMIKKEGMPEDLKYVAVAESALRPHAGSPKGAVGVWQFIESTGRKYGLKIDSEKDERRNIFKSTEAALVYLKELYDILGSWTLSVAAYNMGENGLQSEILAQKNNSYYDLYLPLETQRYVFRILSAKMILSNTEKYGFRFSEADLYAPIQFDRIILEVHQHTPILVIAQASNTTFKVIKDLNPEIRGHYIAAGNHTLLIPEGSAKLFHSRFKNLFDQWLANKREYVYIVKKGDNLSTIAKRFNVPLPALMIWNRLNKNNPIHPGDDLVIYLHETELEEGNQ